MTDFQWLPDQDQIFEASYGSQELTQPHFYKTANTQFMMDAAECTLTLNSQTSSYWPYETGDDYGVCNIEVTQGTLNVNFYPEIDSTVEMRIGAFLPSNITDPKLTTLKILGKLAVTNVPFCMSLYGCETTLMKSGSMVITGKYAGWRLANALISVRDNAIIECDIASFGTNYGDIELHDDSRVNIVAYEMVSYNTLNVSVFDKARLTIKVGTIYTSESYDNAMKFNITGDASNIEFISTDSTPLFDFALPISEENKNRFTFNFLTKDNNGSVLPKNNGEITFDGFTSSSLKKQAAALLSNGYLSIDGQTVTDPDRFVIYTSTFTNRIEVSLKN